jgi:hypothetical protein
MNSASVSRLSAETQYLIGFYDKTRDFRGARFKITQLPEQVAKLRSKKATFINGKKIPAHSGFIIFKF